MSKPVLDDFSYDTASKSPNTRVNALLLLICALIWGFLYQAGNLPYDDNFGCLILAFLLSLGTAIVLVGLYLWRKTYFLPHAIFLTIYVLTSSPPVVWLVLSNYEFVFGKHLAV